MARKAAGEKKVGRPSKVSSGKRSSEAAGVEETIARKIPRGASAIASLRNLKEKSSRADDKPELIRETEDRIADEITAIILTAGGPQADSGLPQRNLFDFIIHDLDGTPVPIEMIEVQDAFVSGLILPKGKESVDRSLGVLCESFGRIEAWSISGFDTGTPTIWISTEVGDYKCMKPASSYKRHFDLLFDKALLCVEVFKKLSKSFGGDPTLGLEELIAGTMRSLSGNKNFSGRNPSMEFIISQGNFIFNHLVCLDEDESMMVITSQNGHLSEIPALIALRDKCKQQGFPSSRPTRSIQINENSAGSSADSFLNKNDKMTQLLHEEELWKAMKQKNQKPRGGVGSGKSQYYIKINETEIASDYPLPAFYKAKVDEADEYLFFEDNGYKLTPDMLPRRTLHNWSLYNSDSRLVPLEIVPMRRGAESDALVFGSGYMLDDDGSGFYEFEVEGPSESDPEESKGIPVYLSSVKEWMIEFGGSMLFASIRTDGAWYRLGKPSKQYSPWFHPVLKIAKVAISIITMLKNETRVSRLSFSDVVRKIAAFSNSDPAFISSNPETVERYVVVHGQVILQQFSEFPDESIRKCPFVNGLTAKMEQMRHTKLAMKKKVSVTKGANQNPVAGFNLDRIKGKAMQATTTKMINRIWGEYCSNYLNEDEGKTVEEEEEDNEEDETVDLVPVQELKKSSLPPKPTNAKSKFNEINWTGDSIGELCSGEKLYARATTSHGDVVALGGSVSVVSDDGSILILFIEYMYEKSNRLKMIHGRIMKKGSETVLGNAANPSELFLLNECMDIKIEDTKETVSVDLLQRPWGHQHRKQYAEEDWLHGLIAEERERKGLPASYFCKSLYAPEKGAFLSIPHDTMGLGNGYCYSCRGRQSEAQSEEFSILSGKPGFVHLGVRYSVNDFLYVNPHQFSEDTVVGQERFKSGKNVGLSPYVICQFLDIEAYNEAEANSTKLKVRRFYRPADLGPERAYAADIREVYHSEEVRIIPAASVLGKCEVRKHHNIPDAHVYAALGHVFFCRRIYDASKGTLKQLPAAVRFESSREDAKDKGKGLEGEERKTHGKNNVFEGDEGTAPRLATLDIFARCGGLSEGLRQSGVSETKWAIECDEVAADAFKLNHKDTRVFNENCNVILRAIMEKCGDKDDCVSTSVAAELAAKLSDDQMANLPLPGQADFINGGPPYQGFSGMNRFNQVQCEMILASLSFADYFRPRFFLLENVRNFISFNKGQTFRLTLASLLEMGYQVRFGVLEAGTFGVAQSGKRAFIWAASPEEALPEWHGPMHVFSSAHLQVTPSEGSHYAAAKSTAGGAPFRSIRVKDAVEDLPPVSNGASDTNMMYLNPPVFWFQKQIRGHMTTLMDHISKEMNELNLIRCHRIPKRPGADWRDLPDEKITLVKLSSGQLVDLIPWCLPHTAKRHNQWKGLLGRLDWEGNFPTSITDPQPMGKVDMCFHPEQDRILTVRECARSQVFSGSYGFWGVIQNRQRQIGNAAPPPLAFALGRKLKEVIDSMR